MRYHGRFFPEFCTQKPGMDSAVCKLVLEYGRRIELDSA